MEEEIDKMTDQGIWEPVKSFGVGPRAGDGPKGGRRRPPHHGPQATQPVRHPGDLPDPSDQGRPGGTARSTDIHQAGLPQRLLPRPPAPRIPPLDHHSDLQRTAPVHETPYGTEGELIGLPEIGGADVGGGPGSGLLHRRHHGVREDPGRT